MISRGVTVIKNMSAETTQSFRLNNKSRNIVPKQKVAEKYCLLAAERFHLHAGGETHAAITALRQNGLTCKGTAAKNIRLHFQELQRGRLSSRKESPKVSGKQKDPVLERIQSPREQKIAQQRQLVGMNASWTVQRYRVARSHSPFVHRTTGVLHQADSETIHMRGSFSSKEVGSAEPDLESRPTLKHPRRAEHLPTVQEQFGVDLYMFFSSQDLAQRRFKELMLVS